MFLKEEFLSIQGEGRYRGELSIFIRFAKCNRTCEDLKIEYKVGDTIKYGCDSYDSVDKAFKHLWKKVTLEDLIIILKKYEDCKNVVLTGGEPLLNIKDNDFISFVNYLKRLDYKITIETNGDIEIQDSEFAKNIIFSISPKEEVASKNYWFLNKDSYIKSIYNHQKISLNYLNKLKTEGMDIFIMPNGNDYKTIDSQKREIFGYCIKNGFNFTDREHINIFKNEAKNESIILDNAMHDNFRWGK
jgi:6-pyruvoyltetrahydropterin 2'-reductase